MDVLLRWEGRDNNAIEYFKAAVNNDSRFAKSMVVEMNPYAAMCNVIIKNVFTTLHQ